MPEGTVRQDLNKTGVTFRNGIQEPVDPQYNSNPVTWQPSPTHFGNPIPALNPSFNSNPVSWSPSASHFGSTSASFVARRQTIVRDNFNRADGGLGSNWTRTFGATTSGTINVKSNAAADTDSANACSFYSNADFSPNQYAQCQINVVGVPVATTVVGPAVRCSSGDNYYRFIANILNNTAQLLKVVNGVSALVDPTQPAHIWSNGDLLRIEITTAPNGTTSNITCYANGVVIFQDTDNDLKTGAPGIAAFSSSAVNYANCDNFEAGDLIWTRQGTFEPASSNAQEPNVIYDVNPILLHGNTQVFKNWYTSGWINPAPVIKYAESLTGLPNSWTEYGSTIMTAVHGDIQKFGSQYYGFMGNNALASTAIDLWTSPDGITWTLSAASVIAIDATHAWEAGSVNNPTVWIEGTTWYMLYDGGVVGNTTYQIGLATSPDGRTWTKYNGGVAPVINNSPGSVGSSQIWKFNGVYYIICGTSASGNLPSDISAYKSTDRVNWTASTKNPIYIRVTSDEGPNLSNAGQVTDPQFIQLNGTTYMFYDATDAQSAGHIHLNVSTVPYTIQQLFENVLF